MRGRCWAVARGPSVPDNQEEKFRQRRAAAQGRGAHEVGAVFRGWSPWPESGRSPISCAMSRQMRYIYRAQLGTTSNLLLLASQVDFIYSCSSCCLPFVQSWIWYLVLLAYCSSNRGFGMCFVECLPATATA